MSGRRSFQMSKIPRDITGKQLIVKLHTLGYRKINQTGSHIRLENSTLPIPHRITIPYHNPIRIGTLSNILNDLANKMNIEKKQLIKLLFD